MTKGERTRQRIIENAISLFAEKGFDSTSVQNIADISELSQAAVFQHYKNKKALLDAVREHLTNKLFAYIDSKKKPTMTSHETLEQYLYCNLEWFTKNREMGQILVLNYYMACFDDEFHKHLKYVVNRAENRILGMVLACQREGFLSLDKDPKWISIHIHDFLIGSITKILATQKEKRVSQKLKERSRFFLENILS